MEVSFPTDSDGFLSQECPSCQQLFKVLMGQGSSEPVSCCPYCGHRGSDCWFTTDQVEYAQAVALATVVAPELRKFERSLRGMSSGPIKFQLKGNIPDPPPPPMEVDDEKLAALHFPCCGETVKVARQSSLFCVICGLEVNMAAVEAKKIFLSHKGFDKAMVKDFKQTLELAGYSP